MFKKIINFFFRLLWFILPNTSSKYWIAFLYVWGFIKSYAVDLLLVLSPIKVIFKNFISDIGLAFSKYWGRFFGLVVQHRLMYIVRLALLIFLLYRPTIIELDSLYWTLSIFFYFITNNVFFFSSYFIPFWDWSFHSPTIKVLLSLVFLPALWTSRRFKRRALKRNKLILRDDEIFSAFQWAQRVFVFTFYFIFCYIAFLFISVFLPLLYVYVFDSNFFDVTKWLYLSYLYPIKYFSLFYNLFFKANFIFFGFIFFKLVVIIFYLLFEIYIFPILIFFLINSFFFFWWWLSYFTLFLVSVLKIFFYPVFKILKLLALLGVFLKPLVTFDISMFGLRAFIDVFKNFLFSDNYVIFIFFILKSIVNFFFFNVLYILKVIFSFLSWTLSLFLPPVLLKVFSINLLFFKDLITLNMCTMIINILDFFINILNTYLKDLSFFGLVSTWYEYLNHGVQRGILRNSFINWIFIHLYASIIAFWFLDFDFRVSVKTPPKTPNTLLKEAKKIYDWIPQNMDFLTLQTNETKIYFAMLDISFEHVESLQFIYGDFEYVDEEQDMEDETPDEEELFNESEETLKVREIIESDLGFTKRPVKMTDGDPLDSKSGLERHYLSEIVGEPELLYIEESLKWFFSSLYSPTFEELHFRDSLFSDWIFDPDEDLTFFEFLLLFPFLLFCVYVWFFHRRKKKHYRAYLRYFMPPRRTVFSGWWVERFLGVSVGERVRYFFDKMRHYTAPDAKFRSVYRFRMYRNRQKFKLMQLEAFHFERLRLKLYRECLKNWEDFTAKSIKFLAPNRKRHYLYSTVRSFKRETREWALMGDWVKYFWKPEPTPERVGYFFDSLQISLPRLIDKYINKVHTRRKLRRGIWRTIEHIPGHISMARSPKHWYSRFANTFLFFPSVTTKYNYNYYNYIGWRNNRAEWRRYAFTPGNVTDKVFEYNRSLQRRDYNLYKRYQRRRRLMRVFQF